MSSPASIPPASALLPRFGYLLGAFGFREILQAIVFIVLARVHPVGFGELFLAMSLGSVVYVVTESGLNPHLATLIAGRTLSSRLLVEVSLLKGLLFVLSWAGLGAFCILSGYSGSLVAVVLIMSAGFGMEAFSGSFFVVLRVQGRQGMESLIRCLAALTGALHCFASLALGFAPPILALFQPLEGTVNMVGSALLAVRRATAEPSSLGLAELWARWRGSLVFLGISLVTLFHNQLTILAIQRLAGSVELAQYGVAWQLVDGLCGVVSDLLVRNTLFPVLLVLWIQDRSLFAQRAREAAGALLLASLPVTAILYLESDRLIALLYGPSYGVAAVVQRGLAVLVVINFLRNLAGYLLIAMGRTRLLLGFTLAGLAANAVACLLLVPHDPLGGSVVAIVSTKLLVAVCTVGACQRSLGLITGALLARAAVAVALAASAILWITPWLGRELASVLALVPLLYACWRHWESFRHE